MICCLKTILLLVLLDFILESYEEVKLIVYVILRKVINLLLILDILIDVNLCIH